MNRLQKDFSLGAFAKESKYLSLESYIPHVRYALTINPPQEVELRIPSTYNKLLEILHYLKASVELYTELSYKNQNVHYHGYIVWHSYIDIATYFMNIQKIQALCQFEVDTIGHSLADEGHYWWYITKQRYFMHSLCLQHKTPCHIKIHPKYMESQAATEAYIKETACRPFDFPRKQRSLKTGSRRSIIRDHLDSIDPFKEDYHYLDD